jgi:hypothetical protein
MVTKVGVCWACVGDEGAGEQGQVGFVAGRGLLGLGAQGGGGLRLVGGV